MAGYSSSRLGCFACGCSWVGLWLFACVHRASAICLVGLCLRRRLSLDLVLRLACSLIGPMASRCGLVHPGTPLSRHGGVKREPFGVRTPPVALCQGTSVAAHSKRQSHLACCIVGASFFLCAGTVNCGTCYIRGPSPQTGRGNGAHRGHGLRQGPRHGCSG